MFESVCVKSKPPTKCGIEDDYSKLILWSSKLVGINGINTFLFLRGQGAELSTDGNPVIDTRNLNYVPKTFTRERLTT